MTLIMIVMICVGSAAIIAGLAVFGIQALRLAKTARAAGLTSRAQLQAVVLKSRRLGPRVQELSEKQRETAERLERISAASNGLRFLVDSLDETTGRITKLKS